jgi:hypothetical protein
MAPPVESNIIVLNLLSATLGVVFIATAIIVGGALN